MPVFIYWIMHIYGELSLIIVIEYRILIIPIIIILVYMK